MALIKCPECGKDVSSTVDACPHCGYKIDKATEIFNTTSDKPTVIIKRNASVSNTVGLIFILLGVVFLVCVIGLGFILGGILTMSMVSKNNSQEKDILYYDSAKDLFIAYDIKGKAYEIEKDKLSGLVSFKQGAKGYTGVLYNKKIQLGWATPEANDKFRSFIQNI